MFVQRRNYERKFGRKQTSPDIHVYIKQTMDSIYLTIHYMDTHKKL